MSVLLVQSQYPVAAGMEGRNVFADAVAEGALRIVRERDLSEDDFDRASGLITTTHLDQIGFPAHAPAVLRLLARGGRWIFNGHIVRTLIPELRIYTPLQEPRRADFELTRLYDHPVFQGIDQARLQTNRGVAGFYGRGHNPPPEGAVAINGIGPQRLAIDWVWQRPEGGEILSHSGNEFWGCGDDPDIKQLLADRAVAWASGAI